MSHPSHSATCEPAPSVPSPGALNIDGQRGHEIQSRIRSPGAPLIGSHADHVKPGRLRRLVRRWGVWRGVLLVTFASTLVAFMITGLAMHISGLEHHLAGYTIALACSVIITPVTMAGLLSLIRRLDETENELYRLARTDELTELPNRRALMEATAEPVADAQPIALLFIDIDHFKRVNDTYGHQTGDEILRRVTRIIASRLRHDDLLCRYGGEEFAALLRQTDAQTAQILAERVRSHVEATPIPVGNSANLMVTLSIGIASAPDARHTGIYQLIDHADRAVYRAKHDGRNCTRQA